MNLYFLHDDGTVVTPETGTILEGITRASIIELAGKMGHQVEERRFAIDEWRDGVASGESPRSSPAAPPPSSPRSARCGGTAARSPPRRRRPTSRCAIRQALVDVQYGRADDTFGWMHRTV